MVKQNKKECLVYGENTTNAFVKNELEENSFV